MKRVSKLVALALSLLLVIGMIPMTAINAKAADVGDFVNRCYSVALGRDADPAGYQDWYNKLVNGEACGAQVGFGFIFSAEYQGKNKTNEAFVTDLYSMFFGRTPDEGGYNDWLGKLNAGTSREEVFAGFANSQEFFNLCSSYGVTAGFYKMGVGVNEQGGVNCFVARLYKVCFGRKGDMGGQADWSNKLMTGQATGAEVAAGFAFSKEFTDKNCSDEEYVGYMYEAFFGRPADEGGKNGWLATLAKNKDREEVFAGFANSAEFNNLCNSYGVKAGEYKYEAKAPANEPEATPTPEATPEPVEDKYYMEKGVTYRDGNFYTEYYDKKDNLVKYEENGKLSFIQECNEQGDIIKAVYYDDNGEIRQTTLCDYKYDDKGNRTYERDEYRYADYTDISTLEYKNEYDSDGKLVKINRTPSDGKVNYVILQYYDNGMLKSTESFDVETGKCYYYDKHEYDGNGNVTRTDWFYDGYYTPYYETYIYEYDNNGNIVKELFSIDQGESYKTYKYEYDTNGHLIKRVNVEDSSEYTEYVWTLK